MGVLFAIGFASGLSLAIPVGPMALLLISTSIQRGWRHGAIGALGMALVDGCYAAAVYFVGSAISGILAQWHVQLGLAGAAIMLGLAAQLFVRNLRRLSRQDSLAVSTGSDGGLGSTFGRFVGATLINPPTALYFLAIAPTVSVLAERQHSLTSGFAGLTFAVAVLLGSLLWQETIALVGAGLRKITTPRIRATIGLVGACALLLMSVGIALSAIAV